MTMLALTLSVGIVIDDAIVVLENIYRFIEEKREDPFRAAVDATAEIGLAVLATTLSLVAIFVPVGFMGGIVGRFMKSFGLTMAFAILVSLLVSFTLTPTLSARWLKVARSGDGKHPPESTIFRGRPLLHAEWSMAHRGSSRAGGPHPSRAFRCSRLQTKLHAQTINRVRDQPARPRARVLSPRRSWRTVSPTPSGNGCLRSTTLWSPSPAAAKTRNVGNACG
jgi:multidrug efflux pump subunit AcrB